MQPPARVLARFQRWILRGIQLAIFLFAGLSAFLLRFDFSVPRNQYRHLACGLFFWVLAKVLCFTLFALDRGWWRYVSVYDIARLAVANLAGSSLASIAILWLGPSGFPRSVYVLDFLICLGLTAGTRVGVRLAFELSRLTHRRSAKRTIIYGAGDAGVALLREIRQNPALTYEVVGFVDDDPAKTGSFIRHTKVFGNGAALPSIVAAQAVENVLIALPSASGAQMTAALQHCIDAGVVYKTIPCLAEVIEGKGIASQIREVAVEDLLGRAPVRLDQDRISAKLTRRAVLVTGAAGSIGSELCRQIARFHPRAIIGFEVAETALFHLEREMRASFPDIPFYPEIGSIQNRRRLAEVLRQYSPSVVYHAAAYKHVPMMEAHVFEAVENNVFGTRSVAIAALEHGVEDFVMISSDKAVRPTSIMGATKRIAELLILDICQKRNGATKFVSVRFGNVLGSNGSVIPIFKQQIAAGGPVTVTHPEMRRYFMTIPEASQLVLQASTMGHGEEIFVLDMGEPVRIVDLARNLILLSGLRPDVDIAIEFSGARPGEKLYEELNRIDEDTLPTHHEKIMIFAGNGLPFIGMEPYLDVLRECCEHRDLAGLVLTFKDLIPDYNPSSDVLSRTMSLGSAWRQPGTAGFEKRSRWAVSPLALLARTSHPSTPTGLLALDSVVHSAVSAPPEPTSLVEAFAPVSGTLAACNPVLLEGSSWPVPSGTWTTLRNPSLFELLPPESSSLSPECT